MCIASWIWELGDEEMSVPVTSYHDDRKPARKNPSYVRNWRSAPTCCRVDAASTCRHHGGPPWPSDAISIESNAIFIASIEPKFANIFKRPKNREDGSDFDDFWTESIVSTQSTSIFSKIFGRKKNRIDRIDRFDRSVGRSIVSIDGRLARV